MLLAVSRMEVDEVCGWESHGAGLLLGELGQGGAGRGGECCACES